MKNNVTNGLEDTCVIKLDFLENHVIVIDKMALYN